MATNRITHVFGDPLYGTSLVIDEYVYSSDSFDIEYGNTTYETKRSSDSVVVDESEALDDIERSDNDLASLDESSTVYYNSESSDQFTAAESENRSVYKYDSDVIDTVESDETGASTSSLESVSVDENGTIYYFPPGSDVITTSDSHSLGVGLFGADSYDINESQRVIDTFKYSSDSFSAADFIESESILLFQKFAIGEGFTVNIKSEPRLVGLWRMNSFGGVMKDESGRGNDGSVVNISQSRPLISGDYASAEFNISSITIPPSDWLNFVKSTFAVECWVDATEGTIIDRAGAWSVWVENDQIYASIEDRNGVSSTGVLHENVAGHIVVIFNRQLNMIHGFINGMSMSNTIYTHDVRSLDGDASITIGSGSHGYLSGAIGELALIAEDIPEERIISRHAHRLKYADYEESIRFNMPNALFFYEDGSVVNDEVADSESISLDVSPGESLLWSKQGAAIDVLDGHIDIYDTPATALEFVIEPSGTNQLLYQHAGIYSSFSVHINESSLVMNEGGESRTVPLSGTSHVFIKFGGYVTQCFVNGRLDSSISVANNYRDETINASLFDGFAGMIQSFTIHGDELSYTTIRQQALIAMSGRVHYRLYEDSESTIQEQGYSTYNFDWSVVSA